MRIISEFRDFYDSALCYGIDPLLIYIRDNKEYSFEFAKEEKKYLPGDMDRVLAPITRILSEMPEDITIYSKNYGRRAIRITPKIVGFCGVLYPAMDIEGFTFYTPQQVVAMLPLEVLKQVYMSREKLNELVERKDMASWSRELTAASWKKTVKDIEGRKFDDVFVGLGVPIFRYEKIYRRYRITVNQCLKSDGFQRIKTPVECFQEISMYIGNQLVHQKDPSTLIPNDVLRDEKGFDKWSFRTQSTAR